MRLRLLTLEGNSPNIADGTGLDVDVALARLAPLHVKPMLRIPMFPGIDPHVYAKKFQAFFLAGYPLMIQPVDSTAMADLSVVGYRSRFEEIIRAIGPVFPSSKIVIECGNEISGERGDSKWPGPRAADKTQAAIAVAKHAGLATAVTYYLPGDDVEWLWEWISKHRLPSVDYSLLSYYPLTTPEAGIVNIGLIMPELARLTTSRWVGIGEYGTERADGTNPSPPDVRAVFVKLFEERPLSCPKDIGGGGYWSAYSDLAEPAIQSALNNAWGTL